MAKDFAGINTGRVYQNIETSTSARGHQETASPQEAAQRAAERRTQGRKGCKSPRMNVGLSSTNYDYVRAMSQATGMTLTGFINLAIERDREAHADMYERVKAFAAEYTQTPTDNTTSELSDLYSIGKREPYEAQVKYVE